MRGARLSAGMLAALAAARPRCAVMTCTAHVGRWGATCDACGDRSEAAVEGDLAATAARKLGARNLRRREGRRKHHAPTAGQDTDPNP
jgi:hypothetical protein